MDSFFGILLGAGAIQGVFIAAALAGHRRGRRAADIMLACLMLVFSANIVHAGFLKGWISGAGNPETFEPFQLLFGPLVYLYVRLVAGSTAVERRFKAPDLQHFIPALAATVSIPTLARLLPAGAGRAVDLASWAFSVAYLLVYVVLTTRGIHVHRDRLRQEYSGPGAADLGWVRVIMHAFLAVELLNIVLLVWLVHGNPFPYFGKLLALASTLLAYGLGYRGLTRRIPDPDGPVPDATAPGSAPKYSRSGLGAREAAAIETELLLAMEGERLWSDPDFSLQKLSDRLGWPRNQLSQVINASFGRSFYDFVNGYRVREVQRLLAEPGAGRFRMLALAFEAGFASKPTFNAAFKKAAGVTPSRYRAGLAGRTGPSGTNG